MAVKGTSFLESARQSINLIKANVVDLAVVNTIGEILMMLGKLFVTCTCAFIAFYMMDNMEQFQEDGDDSLTSTWLPVLVRAQWDGDVSRFRFLSFASRSRGWMLFADHDDLRVLRGLRILLCCGYLHRHHLAVLLHRAFHATALWLPLAICTGVVSNILVRGAHLCLVFCRTRKRTVVLPCT